MRLRHQMSTCTGLSAIDHANTKYHKGYAATGVGAVVCARHEFMLPNGVGDLQVGERYVRVLLACPITPSRPLRERYANMDYIFVSAMLLCLVEKKIITYDIACQWSVHLLERIKKFPRHLQINVPDGSLSYAIPKLHWYSHRREAHAHFCLNFLKGVARLDGEGIERRWWWVEPIANAIRGMGPGNRQGILEDLWGYANWRKLVTLGTSRSHHGAELGLRLMAVNFSLDSAQSAPNCSPRRHRTADHLCGISVFESKEKSLHYLVDDLKGLPALIEWMRFGSGPMTTNVAEAGAFVRVAV